MDGFLLQPKGGAAGEWIPRVISYLSRQRLREGLCKELVQRDKPSPCQLWRANLAWPELPTGCGHGPDAQESGCRVKPG